MPTIKKQWSSGTGEVTIEYGGSGNGQITISSDGNNLYEARTMQIVVQTTAGSHQQTKTINISQAARVRIDISNAVVTADNQTYSGSALTPVPTVVLNGITIPSTSYDVTYSDNTNAGTATVTVTGKGDYTGTASGTFNIAKDNPTYTAPAAQSLTYSGSSQYLTTAGSTSHGTIQYSADDTNWYTTRRTETDAGTYTTYWRLVGDANHNDVASTSISVTIAQKALTITAKAQTITYGGSIATGTSQVTTSGLVSGDTLTAVTLTASTSSVTTSGTITPSAATTSNGIGNYSVTYNTGNLTINKADSSVTSAPTAKSLTYSRSAQGLVNPGSASGGTLYYKYTTTNSKPTSTSGFSSSIPTCTNAGTYYVWYYVKGDSNHNDMAINSTAVTVTIAKATPVVATAPSKRTGLSYTGSAQNLLSGGSMKHSSSDSTSVAGTFTYAQGTNAGSYSSLTWSFAPTDSTNYNSASGTVSGSVSIAKASRTLSFPNAYVVLAPSGNITKTATPSAGSGDGAITYSIGSTTYATINSSSGKVTAKTTEGNTIVTATITEGTNYLGATATYTLYVFAATHNYSYTGSAQSVTLPPGSYKLQVWGAQGGSNTADSSHAISAKSGGKGGYSEGQLTISSATTVKVYVGGQGSSSAAGYNGGGTTMGSSSYSSNNIYGLSKMGGGGGASDIRLSDGDLLSRMIVAGGGSGGAMCCKETSTSVTEEITVSSFTYEGICPKGGVMVASDYGGAFIDVKDYQGCPAAITAKSLSYDAYIYFMSNAEKPGLGDSYTQTGSPYNISPGNTRTINVPSNANWAWVHYNSAQSVDKIVFTKTTTTVTRETLYQEGYAGGGTLSKGYNSYIAGQTSGGSGNGAGFGTGANVFSNTYKYVSAAGGGGWYGGGGGVYDDTDINYIKRSGGGSGWVNISANASYRPNGYTGLQLDSGTTKDGTQTFAGPSGTNETGHSGNGYARITRL